MHAHLCHHMFMSLRFYCALPCAHLHVLTRSHGQVPLVVCASQSAHLVRLAYDVGFWGLELKGAGFMLP